MQRTPTLFLKSVIYLIGLGVLGLCIILAGVTFSGNAGSYWPVLLLALAAAVPFFYALRQGLLLLSLIEENNAFSERSVQAIRTIKNCALTISALYGVGMPFLIYAAEVDDAPGAPVVGIVLISASFVTAVFAAVLERLFASAIEIKSENELTV